MGILEREGDSMISKLQGLILKLNHECQFCIVAIRLDYNDSAWHSVSDVMKIFSQLVNLVQEEFPKDKALEMAECLGQLLPGLISAQKNRDMCLIADIVENDLLPYLRELNADLVGVSDEVLRVGDMLFQRNVAGDAVIACDKGEGRVWLTGQFHPFTDAVQYFFEYRDPTKTYYALAGGCMIYDALAIMRVQIDTKVYIIEEDQYVVKALKELFELEEYIAAGRISFVTENVLRAVSKYVKEQTLLVKPASLLTATSKELENIYSHYRMVKLSHMEESYLLYKNFHENCGVPGWKHVSEKKSSFAGKKAYFVAGGPSLGNCFELLRNRDKETSVILCVGTSAGKLLKEHINPDFVIISDPLPEMEKQLAQPFDYTKTSLIYACSAYGRAVDKFGGEKFVAFQKYFELAEEVAKENNLPVYETGGSVSTFALDILLNLEVAEIVCLGLDLAYTNNKMHVARANEINDVEEDEPGFLVKSVSGAMVQTVKNLNSYRLWIEKRLQRYSGNTRFINVSDGAFIEGMENVPTDKGEPLL